MINEIKSKISCLDYLARHGIFVKNGGRCVSPLRPGAKNPTSFFCDEKQWYDFGAATGGDVIDLAAKLEYNGDVGEAIRSLARELGIRSQSPTKPDTWKHDIQNLCNRAAAYHAALTPEDFQYLAGRGLSRDDIDRLMIGRVTDGYLKGRLFLPYFKNGYVCYYATRALPGGSFPENKYMKASLSECDSYEHVPWGLHTLPHRSDVLVIAEGYFDAAAFEREGYAVLSPITGNFSATQWPEVIAACRMFPRVMLIFDNDAVSHAGDGFTERTARKLFQNNIEFVVGHTPSDIKDVNDYYTSGGSLQKLLDEAQDGLKFMASLCKTPVELKNFVMSINRFVDITTITAALMPLKDKFEPAVIKSILDDAKKAPLETMIVDDVSKRHNLIFVENDGFYEWTGKIWSKISDFTVEKYAGDAYGKTFKTAQRMVQVRKHLCSEKLRIVEFNKQNIMNFPNGTLELDTGTFREHRENDYCSFMQSYEYDPDATCPRWVKFIEECTDEDPKRMDALQTIMGYVMLADCRYQLMFLLMGKGGNGKSVYLDIMKELFGADNCTTVDPEQMNDNFQRILLRDSLVNYASEITGDMSQTVKWVKAIACGEQINGCYKGKDNINFTTRCKMIFSCNSSPKTRVIEGLDRRLFFIDFPLKFVDFPDPADRSQRLADRDIIPKLLKELPGIFNWAYEGYKLLNTVKYFTETEEQAYYLQRFKETSNPLVTFCEDCEHLFVGMVRRDDLYDDYADWCTRNGHNPKPSTNFFPDFCAVMGDRVENPKYRPWAKNGARPQYIVFRQQDSQG